MKSSEHGNRRRSGRDRDHRPDHRRTALAVEAARIMQEQGLTDFRGAKAKALERLGLGKGAPLPNNEEIEAALAERNRLFYADSQPELLAEMRRAARGMMQALEQFYPRLVGDVLSGTTTQHSNVELHLFSDAAESVGASLDAQGIAYRVVERRHRLRRETVESFPGFRFSVLGCGFSSSVFPLRLRGHPPLSGVDGKPMHRGTLREVEQLLGEDLQT